MMDDQVQNVVSAFRVRRPILLASEPRERLIYSSTPRHPPDLEMIEDFDPSSHRRDEFVHLNHVLGSSSIWFDEHHDQKGPSLT